MRRYLSASLRSQVRTRKALTTLAAIGVALGVAAALSIQIINRSALAAFRGSVDRVDAATVTPEDGFVQLNVIDYKSGQTKFEVDKMQAGLQLQLPAYLAALCAVAPESGMLNGVVLEPDGAPAVEARVALGDRLTRTDERGLFHFRLDEVELVIEERALGEFTGFGQPGAELDRRVDEQRHDDGPAVAVKLDDRFAGERRRAREMKCQSLVQSLPARIHERDISGDSRFR